MLRFVLLLTLGMPAIAGQPTKRPSDAERGRELYVRHCAACHGPANAGDGPATSALVVPVPDLRGKVRADDAVIKVVLRGQGAMPGYEATFDKADARRVLQHMATVHTAKSTAPKPAVVDDAPEEDPPEGGEN
jgi:mono/diheme cytochrome c family protein